MIGLFLWVAVLSLSLFVNFMRTDASHELVLEAGKSKSEMMATLDESLKNEDIKTQLTASGNSEAYKDKVALVKQTITDKINDFSRRIPSLILFSKILLLLLAMSSITAIAGLLLKKRWARFAGMAAVILSFFTYLLLLLPAFLALDILQLVCNSGHEINMMVNPVYTDFLYCTGSYYFIKFLFGFPYVFVHGFVLLLGVAVLLFLNHSSIKEQLN